MSRKVKTANSLPGANSEKSAGPKCEGASESAKVSKYATSANEEISQQIIDLALDAFISIDESQTIVLFNKGAEKIFGYTAEEVLGKSLNIILPASVSATHHKYVKSFTESDTQNEYISERAELTGLRKNGEEFPAEATISRGRLNDEVLFTFVLRDRTEQRNRETILRQSEAEYRKIIEEFLNEIYIFDSETFKFIQVNRGAQENLGYSQEELFGMTPLDIKPEFTEESFFEITKPLISGEKRKIKFETIHRRKDGSHYNVEVHLQLSQLDGRLVYVAMVLDITERKKIEETLLEGEELLRATIESTADGILAVNSEGKITNTNTRFLDMWRIPDELRDENNDAALIDFVISQLVNPESFVKKVMDLYGSSEDSFDVINFRDGRIFERYSCPLIREGKDIVGRVWSFRDITERKQTERALRLTQFSIDKSADLAFWINHAGKFIYVNDAACITLGYGREELLKLKISDINDNFPEKSWSNFWNEIKSKGAITIESTIKGSNGGVFPVEIHANYLNFEGREYVFAFVKDISDREVAQKNRRELQERLERAKRMESLGLLAGGVAHDLNNMLGPLVGYPDLILRKLPEDTPVRKQIIKMGKAATDAADVIQDLLALARRGRYEMAPLELNTVIRDYLESPAFESLREKRPDVTVREDFDETLGQINGSAPHLAKVIMNLVVNAYDAMPDGGELTIKTEHGVISKLLSGYDDVEPGEYAFFRIKDSGTGIDPEYLKNIFDPYFSRKKMGQQSGSGLGLSVVYGIVKDHKGYYDIFSELNKGTEFVLYFPRLETQQENIPSRIDKLVAGNTTQGLIIGKQRILVVDDDESQREMVFEMLSTLGYKVDLASSGVVAIEMIKKQPVDLLVLDMILEDGFDGLDTFREIRNIYPDQKAIIVSGYSATDRVEKLQSLGAGSYVRKPYTRKTLATAIREELDIGGSPAKPAVLTSS